MPVPTTELPSPAAPIAPTTLPPPIPAHAPVVEVTRAERPIYVVGNSTHYINWMQGKLVDRMEDAALCVWTGGSDCSPALYGKARHYSTHPAPQRDLEEVGAFLKARRLGKKLIGICRGAQLLNCLAGGILVQDQADSSQITHWVDTFDGQRFRVSSSHHQACYPWHLPTEAFKVLAWSTGVSTFHFGETDKDEMVNGKVEGAKELEEVYFPEIDALCIQSHPENMVAMSFASPEAERSIARHRYLLDAHMEGRLASL